MQFNDARDDGGRLVAGVELYSDRVDSARAELTDGGALLPRTPRFGDGARMRSASAFVVPELAVSERLTVTAGLRASVYRIEVPASPVAEDVDVDARELTGRLGVHWRVRDRWTLYGSYGHGFRPPNVFDLGTLGPRPGNRFNVANPGLGPETLDNLEAGVRFGVDGFSLEATVFAADHEDRIRSVDTGTTTASGRDVVRSVNGGTSRLRGAELQLRWRPRPGTELDAVLNAVRGEDDFAGEVTPGDRIPPLNGLLRLRQRLSPVLTGTLAVTGAARQDRLSARDVRDPRIDPSGTDGWLRVDAVLAGRLREGADVRFEFGNLANARYREHGSGLDAPGRYLSVGIDWAL